MNNMNLKDMVEHPDEYTHARLGQAIAALLAERQERKSDPYTCRHCGEEIALIPDWPLANYKPWHHVKATDNDSDGRYHIDCADEDAFEAEL